MVHDPARLPGMTPGPLLFPMVRLSVLLLHHAMAVSCETAVCASRLNLDAFDLIERDRIAGAVVELGRLRAFVGRHGVNWHIDRHGFPLAR